MTKTIHSEIKACIRSKIDKEISTYIDSCDKMPYNNDVEREKVFNNLKIADKLQSIIDLLMTYKHL